MAGESPDMSEQRKSSGDPGADRPAAGSRSGAGSPADGSGAASAAAGAKAGNGGRPDPRVAVRDGAAGGGKGGKADEGGKADKADKAAEAAPVTGTAKSGSAGGGTAAAGGGKADQATAVFGAVKTAEAEDESGADADVKADVEAGQATAVSGAEDGQTPAASDSSSKDGEASAAKADAAGSAEKAPAVSGTAKDTKDAKADQATAVIGTVEPPKGDAEAEPKAASWGAGNGKPKEDARLKAAVAAWVADTEDKDDAADAKPAAAADQPTELIEAPKAPNAPKTPKASADQPTELIKAPANPDSESERTSQFVPLKKDDAPAPPKPLKTPKPEAKPKAEAKVEAEPKAAPPAPPKAEEPAEPKAPLDLLAQLTNTPPPPETPTRTVMRRVKIWTPLVILLGIIFVAVQAFRPLPDAKLALGEKKAFTFGGGEFAMPWPDQGQSAVKVVGAGDVGTSGEQKPVPTASVAKVMTAYVILKDHPLKKGEQGPMIKIDAQSEKEAGAQDESRVPVKEGQEFSEFNMLRMLLIPSGNNIARQLARWDAGSEEAFVKKMNDAAKELGMTNTTYTDPSGLTETTVSTAADQVKLGEPAIKNEVIRDITQQPNADIPGLSPARINNNNDTLLVKHTGVLGLKTGSSSHAGGALLWAARKTFGKQEYLIVGATMDQHFKGLDPNAENSLTMVKDRSYKQITALQDVMTTATVVKKGDLVGYVDDGLGGRTPVVATKDVTAVGWPGFSSKFALDTAGKKIPHTAKAGTEVGELVVGSGDSAVKVPVALQKDLAEPSFGSKVIRLG
ncbi:D-alanyl-D-alanine carboxypeptidase [Streptomyces morookaense]|uniref:D-alanyl-D-alanine carboxypeptidase n=1 Tax=Streptomyces morookaense TaxID=1970 RepID=A0A7Y7B4S1_STRMO|nr:D-alanyl-D-alanine carboxypeptidase [Streptomyces morookaense]GHF09809.1 D-alanyl-D-alanine carboxypeptidase [Streptomyces morookaense]